MPFQKGHASNPAGGKKGEARLDLERAIKRVGKRKGKKFWEHVAEQAYTDNSVLNAILRKLVPDLKSLDANITQLEPFRLILSKGHKSTKPDDSDPPGQ